MYNNQILIDKHQAKIKSSTHDSCQKRGFTYQVWGCLASLAADHNVALDP